MLQTLNIENVALISKLSIDFGSGLNILLGETGAGKSIIFDSINFVLGAKLDKTLLRTGETAMKVDAVFSGFNENAQAKLQELGFDDDEILLSRTYFADGKSVCKINGAPAVTSMLREVGNVLLDSYSQHESIELLKTKNHLAMIDKYAGEKISSIKNELSDYYRKYKDILAQIEKLGGNEYERERTKSLLEYQINEIEDAKLQVGEDADIAERLKILNSAEKICEAIGECELLLSDNPNSAISALDTSASLLNQLDIEKISDCRERLVSARIELEDIYETLVDVKDECEFDEKEFNRLDSRLDTIKSLSKKYGGSVEKVLEYLEQAKKNYNELNDSEYLLSKLSKEKDEILEAFS